MGEEWAKGLDLSEQIAKYAAGDLTAYQVATNKMGSTKIEWTGLRESVQEMTPELDKVISAAEAAGVAIPDGLEEGLRSGEMSTEDAISLLTKSLQGPFEGLYFWRGEGRGREGGSCEEAPWEAWLQTPPPPPPVSTVEGFMLPGRP